MPVVEPPASLIEPAARVTVSVGRTRVTRIASSANCGVAPPKSAVSKSNCRSFTLTRYVRVVNWPAAVLSMS